MRYVDKIEIKYLRSLNDVTFDRVNDLNIISGANDTGKSNVLYALKLFLESRDCNFALDFSKRRAEVIEKVRGKQTIRIVVTFNMPKSVVLPSKIKCTKVWDRTGKIINSYNDLESKLKGKPSNEIRSAQRQLTAFLNKLVFVFVPAVRDERFFKHILNLLQDSIFSAEERKKKSDLSDVASYAQKFNEKLKGGTQKLNDLFQSASGIDTSLSVPTTLVELFSALQVDTFEGQHEIPITYRGQGVRMQYIPTILDYIAQISNKKYIWGFDEPENSCEYLLASKLAKEFEGNYSKKTQIFAVSHSFSFISLKGNNVSTYRIIRNELSSNVEKVVHGGEIHENLKNDLGFLDLSDQLKETFNDYVSKKKLAEGIIEKSSQYSLLFEGVTDKDHFKMSFQKLFNKDLENLFNIYNLTDAHMSTGASALRIFLKDHVERMDSRQIIAIFDCDHEGMNQIKSLKKERPIYKDIGTDEGFLKHKNKEIYVIRLLPPSFRNKFVTIKQPQWCYLTTELLYEDGVIPAANREIVAPGSELFKYKGDKRNFVDKIRKASDTINFSGFKTTWDKILEITKVAP